MKKDSFQRGGQIEDRVAWRCCISISVAIKGVNDSMIEFLHFVSKDSV